MTGASARRARWFRGGGGYRGAGDVRRIKVDRVRRSACTGPATPQPVRCHSAPASSLRPARAVPPADVRQTASIIFANWHQCQTPSLECPPSQDDVRRSLLRSPRVPATSPLVPCPLVPSSRAPRDRRPRQLDLHLPTWGGRRAGAGRKPRGERPGVAHTPRPRLASRYPVHVTLRVRPHVFQLRSRRCFRVLGAAFLAARERHGVRLCHYSVQGNHVHLLVEARDAAALGRAMKGLGVRLARGLNRLMGTRGAVLADRYHARILRTPREIRHALAYVLGNHRDHARQWAPHLADLGRPAPRFRTPRWRGRPRSVQLRAQLRRLATNRGRGRGRGRGRERGRGRGRRRTPGDPGRGAAHLAALGGLAAARAPRAPLARQAALPGGRPARGPSRPRASAQAYPWSSGNISASMSAWLASTFGVSSPPRWAAKRRRTPSGASPSA